MSRLDIKTPSKAQMVVEHLYRSMEHRIEATCLPSVRANTAFGTPLVHLLTLGRQTISAAEWGNIFAPENFRQDTSLEYQVANGRSSSRTRRVHE